MIRLLLEVQIDAADEGPFWESVKAAAKSQSNPVFMKVAERSETGVGTEEGDVRRLAFTGLQDSRDLGAAGQDSSKMHDRTRPSNFH